MIPLIFGVSIPDQNIPYPLADSNTSTNKPTVKLCDANYGDFHYEIAILIVFVVCFIIGLVYSFFGSFKYNKQLFLQFNFVFFFFRLPFLQSCAVPDWISIRLHSDLLSMRLTTTCARVSQRCYSRLCRNFVRSRYNAGSIRRPVYEWISYWTVRRADCYAPAGHFLHSSLSLGDYRHIFLLRIAISPDHTQVATSMLSDQH